MTATSQGGAAEFFEELRKEYLLEAAARLGEIRKDVAALTSGESDAAASLKVRFHRLAGSGGSYGFPEISSAARQAEQWIIAHSEASPANGVHLGELVAGIAEAFDRAALTLGLPASAPKPAAFGWVAAIIGYPSYLADRVDATLADAQYTVRRQPMGAEPGDRPVSERPDLVVILAGEIEETADAVRRWSRASPRPAAVVLVAPADGFDPLCQPFATLDGLIATDRVEADLLTSARSLGRAASTPRSVLIVDRDREPATGLVRALEGGQVRVVVRAGGFAAREFLQTEAPDLILIGSEIGDTTVAALIGWIRRQAALRLTPIVVGLAAPNDELRLAAVRAGADDAVALTAAAGSLSELLLARIERARQIRALAHRDDLTGLLNHEAMTEELDRALNLARRTNESLAFLTIDLDHFRRINERMGPSVGDGVLVHVARVIGGSVRSSDLVARMGGEEFGILVRRCQPQDAARVAEKIRNAIREAPCQAGGEEIAIHVSIGVACHPDHGFGAADLLRAADKALATAKAAGRDRTAVAG